MRGGGLKHRASLLLHLAVADGCATRGTMVRPLHDPRAALVASNVRLCRVRSASATIRQPPRSSWPVAPPRRLWPMAFSAVPVDGHRPDDEFKAVDFPCAEEMAPIAARDRPSAHPRPDVASTSVGPALVVLAASGNGVSARFPRLGLSSRCALRIDGARHGRSDHTYPGIRNGKPTAPTSRCVVVPNARHQLCVSWHACAVTNGAGRVASRSALRR